MPDYMPFRTQILRNAAEEIFDVPFGVHIETSGTAGWHGMSPLKLHRPAFVCGMKSIIVLDFPNFSFQKECLPRVRDCLSFCKKYSRADGKSPGE
jgi:hypothetical protein